MGSHQKTDVVLVNMPFAALFRPSIGLSTLKAELTRQGVSCKVLYFTIPFAEKIGTEIYVEIANQYPRPSDLLGEWIFSPALFDFSSTNPRDYIDEISSAYSAPVEMQFFNPQLTGIIHKIRERVAHFIEECAQVILSYSPKIVGLTSVFQQNVSSLALAKKIKANAPETFIALGGSNCESIMGMEMKRQFVFLDAVVSGEGEIVFPQIVHRVFEGKSVSDLMGVFTSENLTQILKQELTPNAQKTLNLDELPFPDYDDFFEQHSRSSLDKKIERQLLFETSRGCWWGEVSHCTFCGLSSESMSYRSKSPARALEELEYLTTRYPGCSVTVVDNILDLKYLKDFLPELAKKKLNFELFYETKANLKKEQLKLMREAGITSIQPGVESFSDKLLQQMGKGVKALQNIQLLKWCKEFGIKPYWNILWGFPDEDPAEYEKMADLIPVLSHLPVPQCAGQLRLDRFSPNFKFANRFGFVNVRPYPSYFHVYPFESNVLSNLAYYFLYDYSDKRDVSIYTERLWNEVVLWRKTNTTNELFSVNKGSHLLIWDLRPIAQQPLTILTGLEKVLYDCCESICTVNQLKQAAEGYSGNAFDVHEIEARLEPILKLQLMLKENNSYLSLAIPLGNYSPNKAVIDRFYVMASQLGYSTENEIVIPTTCDVF